MDISKGSLLKMTLGNDSVINLYATSNFFQEKLGHGDPNRSSILWAYPSYGISEMDLYQIQLNGLKSITVHLTNGHDEHNIQEKNSKRIRYISYCVRSN